MAPTSTSAIKVAVLGGGVAGMSAAHELAERGFSVDVYERQPVYVGGKARSVDVPGTGQDNRPNLPGEHGFRFFPGFYQHVTDTMKRIPYGNNKQGVFDNLVESTRVLLARTGQPPLPALVNFPKTQADFKTLWLDLASAHTGLSTSDMELFGSSLWHILTSCYERRQQVHERMSWWDFMQTDEQRAHDGISPQAPFPYELYCVGGLTHSLVAAQPKLMSVKTGGDILLQLLLLMLNPKAHTDRVLNGPTNEVWLQPWLAHLTTNLGVRYHHHHYVSRLECDPVGERLTGAYMRYDVDSPEQRIEADYYVAAVPLERMAQLINDDMLAVDKTLGFITTLADPKSEALNWMNGIQYYLKDDVQLVHGHIICLDSPWAVTGISQAQFWKSHPLTSYGDGTIKGIISVDVSNWFDKGLNGKMASECTLEEVRDEVWAELKDSLRDANGQPLLTDWAAYHIDSDIEFSHEPTPPPIHSPFKASHNTEPLLVNTANSWSLRPESFCRIRNLFLASDYVRTNTDLATMEGANEAARRAVNGIIAASGVNAPFCQIWPLHEPDVLAVLRWRDRQLFAKGLPWTDVLGEWPTRLLHEGNYWWQRLRGKA